MPRAVLDTHVFVSALLGRGFPRVLYEAFKNGAFWLVTSRQLLAEVRDLLILDLFRGIRILRPEKFLKALSA